MEDQAALILGVKMNGFFIPTNSDTYAVFSYGNGWAYSIEDVNTGESVWVQDQDAIQLQHDTDNFNNINVIDDYFFTLNGG